MKIDRFKIYFLELFLFTFLLFTVFGLNIITKTKLAIVLFLYMILCKIILKKRKSLPIYHKQVTILLVIFALIYLAAFYLMGIYFGFYEATVKFSLWSIKKYIIPLMVIIISSEIIRNTLLIQKGKKSKGLALLIMVLIDLIIYTGIYDLNNLDDFLTVVGFIFFASFSCNLLYNYISIRYGYIGIIIYRIITVLYVYFIPIVPDVYVFFKSVLRMVYPYLIYLVLDYTYEKRNFIADYVDQRKKMLNTTFLVIFATIVSMLVSCQFRFGIIVVGSGSMTGALNKGDATIYESYNNQDIKEGDVIIFKKDDIRIIHRVIDIKKINGQVQYYTKGDANQQMDEGYVTRSEIVGITLFRIKYVGYPSIWIKDIFSNM